MHVILIFFFADAAGSGNQAGPVFLDDNLCSVPPNAQRSNKMAYMGLLDLTKALPLVLLHKSYSVSTYGLAVTEQKQSHFQSKQWTIHGDELLRPLMALPYRCISLACLGRGLVHLAEAMLSIEYQLFSARRGCFNNTVNVCSSTYEYQ